MADNRSLTYINRSLLVIILGINIYLIGAPLWPQFSYRLAKHRTAAVHGLPYKTRSSGEGSLNNTRSDIPADNRLVIPSMALNTPILSGTSPSTVNKGVWLRPNTSIPSSGSNTVLAGHRFSYRGAPSLYHLNKVKTGDTVAVYWQKTEYLYHVKEIKVVPATAGEIEDPTDEPRLTIYTCTPLWSVKDRLVVIAGLITGESQ